MDCFARNSVVTKMTERAPNRLCARVIRVVTKITERAVKYPCAHVIANPDRGEATISPKVIQPTDIYELDCFGLCPRNDGYRRHIILFSLQLYCEPRRGEAIRKRRADGLLRRSAPRNDGKRIFGTTPMTNSFAVIHTITDMMHDSSAGIGAHPERTPNRWEHTPDHWEHTPKTWERTPDSWEHTPDRWERTPNTWEHTPNSWEHTPDHWEHTPKTWEHTPDRWERTPEGRFIDQIIIAIRRDVPGILSRMRKPESIRRYRTERILMSFFRSAMIRRPDDKFYFKQALKHPSIEKDQR